MKICSVCRHPDKDQIDQALVANEPFRHLAAQYGTSSTALYRHKVNDLPETLLKAEEASELARADDLAEQLKDLQIKARTVWASAEEAGDRKSMLGSIREERATIETLGKLLGRFNERSAQENGSEHHPLLREPLEIRRWFLLSGRMPTNEERETLKALRDGGEVDSELIKKMLGVKPKT